MDALEASKIIPVEMTAADAANDLCTYMPDNLAKQEQKGTGEILVVPTGLRKAKINVAGRAAASSRYWQSRH